MNLDLCPSPQVETGGTAAKRRLSNLQVGQEANTPKIHYPPHPLRGCGREGETDNVAKMRVFLYFGFGGASEESGAPAVRCVLLPHRRHRPSVAKWRDRECAAAAAVQLSGECKQA